MALDGVTTAAAARAERRAIALSTASRAPRDPAHAHGRVMQSVVRDEDHRPAAGQRCEAAAGDEHTGAPARERALLPQHPAGGARRRQRRHRVAVRQDRAHDRLQRRVDEQRPAQVARTAAGELLGHGDRPCPAAAVAGPAGVEDDVDHGASSARRRRSKCSGRWRSSTRARAAPPSRSRSAASSSSASNAPASAPASPAGTCSPVTPCSTTRARRRPRRRRSTAWRTRPPRRRRARSPRRPAAAPRGRRRSAARGRRRGDRGRRVARPGRARQTRRSFPARRRRSAAAAPARPRRRRRCTSARRSHVEHAAPGAGDRVVALVRVRGIEAADGEDERLARRRRQRRLRLRARGEPRVDRQRDDVNPTWSQPAAALHPDRRERGARPHRRAAADRSPLPGRHRGPHLRAVRDEHHARSHERRAGVRHRQQPGVQAADPARAQADRGARGGRAERDLARGPSGRHAVALAAVQVDPSDRQAAALDRAADALDPAAEPLRGREDQHPRVVRWPRLPVHHVGRPQLIRSHPRAARRRAPAAIPAG